MNKIRVDHREPLAYYEIAYFIKDYFNKDTIIVGIGTDRCVGDSIGPLVGTMLKDKNFPFPVYGTLEEPIHALNLETKLAQIKKAHPNATIIGVDACLGDTDYIGELQGRDFPVHPGRGVGKSLPDVGEASIMAIVDSADNQEMFSNRTIRLNLIMNMSKTITNALIHAAYISKQLSNRQAVV